LASVELHTSRTDIEILIVDDASDDEVNKALVARAAQLSKNGIQTKVLRNKSRESFSHNNNLAAKEAKGNFLCLLNNDTYVTAGWLEALLDVVDSDPTIAVVGNKHIFPNTGLLHHCGVGLDDEGHPYHFHPHSNPALPSANYQRELQIVSFACVLIRTEIYQKLSGLNVEYRNGYEDCDFCLRARKQGYKVAYTPASVIYHYGQSTPGRKDTDKSNWELFRSHWPSQSLRDFVSVSETDEKFNASILAAPRRVSQSKEGIHIAVDLSAGSALSWLSAEFALSLAEHGKKVSLPKCELTNTIEPEKRKILSDLMMGSPLGTYHLKINHYWKNFIEQDLWGEVNAEFFVTNYRFRGDIKPLDPWSAHTLYNEYRKLPMSGFCLDSLTDFGVAKDRCKVVPLGYAREIDSLGIVKKDSVGEDLNILLTTNSHDLLRYGTDISVSALAKAFNRQDPVVVHIKDYGAGAGDGLLRKWIASHPNFPRVVWHETFVTKEELLHLYASMDVAVAPFRGEGFSMKVLDAMALGIPVMMPAFGGPLEYARNGNFIDLPFREVPVGECYDTRNSFVGPGAYWCEVNTEQLTTELTKLLDSRHNLLTIGEKARNDVLGVYSWDSAADKLVDALEVWSAERARVVSVNLAPSKLPVSVIIPTHNREEVLELTLQGYQKQTLNKSLFEIILVNDHGKKNRLDEIVNTHSNTLKLSFFENDGAHGPGAARNLAIRKARGEVVFITGDDIVPAPDLLELHLESHLEHPELEAGFVGLNSWHPDLDLTWMMKHIVEAGGQQFNYNNMVDRKPAPFDRFYTSNVSVKRRFLAQMEHLFNPWFRLAAFEDIELAYRLHLRGLQLYYLEDAVGFHHHQMTVRGMSERQRKCGRMLTIMAEMHPKFIPIQHQLYLDALQSEFRKRLVSPIQDEIGDWKETFEFLIKRFESVEKFLGTTNRGIDVPHLKSELSKVDSQMAEIRTQLFDGVLDLMLRVGMAEEWAAGSNEENWAPNWTSLMATSEVFRSSISQSSHETTSNASANGRTSLTKTASEVTEQNKQLQQLKVEVQELRTVVSQFSVSARMKHKIKTVGRKFITFGH